LHPELQAWRQRHGRADRIGDADEDGNIPDWAVASFRERHPERSGTHTSAPLGRISHRSHLSGGRYDLGYFIPNRIT
jgi:hypothetical protein